LHPSERIRGTLSRRLDGRRIVLGVTGSIAAVKSVELARELIRHGADVLPVMTQDAVRILHPNALEFATGHRPVLELTGAVEHVRDMGRSPGKVDLLLVAPCTGNTLSKISLGIDDSPVTTYASTALATTKMVIAPAMHDSMYENEFLLERLAALRKAGVAIVAPLFDENKAKLADIEAIVEEVIRAIGPSPLVGRRLLVIAGSTIEPLDGMRVLTNRSTGRMGLALASEAFRMGAEVELWWGHGHASPPSHIPIRRFVTVEDLGRMAADAARFDAVLVPAALSDFGPANGQAHGKIPSDRPHELHLVPLPKVLDLLRASSSNVLIPFKAEHGAEESVLVSKARASLRQHRAPFVVANDLNAVSPDSTEVLLVEEARTERHKGSKEDVARAILSRLAREWPVPRAGDSPGRA
jgi:phosphopantothenoylcysteine decarboxylase/phosphopantothenate--cysteine ligase